MKAYSDKWQRTLKDSMRSTLYDTVSDRYARFLRDEILAEVAAKYNLRKDAYSHAITGLSSGGICTFNAAWQMPDQFSRVITWIGSFVSIQWKEDPAHSGRRAGLSRQGFARAQRNIRVWLQDGSDDLENDATATGRWPIFAWPMRSSPRNTISISASARARTTPATARRSFPRR